MITVIVQDSIGEITRYNNIEEWSIKEGILYLMNTRKSLFTIKAPYWEITEEV